jgi:uncharacterized membrane-anchored protein YjiN (DUF445 family)
MRNALIHKKIDAFLQKTNFADVVSNIVAHFSEENQHQQLLDLGIKALKTYLESPTNQKKIKTRIRENSPKLVPFFVDDMRILPSNQKNIFEKPIILNATK